MGPIQSSLNSLVRSGATAAIAISGADDEKDKDAGIDAKMAAKARRIAQTKIKAIQANKDLSEKARTRRIGKVIDEYQASIAIGGKK